MNTFVRWEVRDIGTTTNVFNLCPVCGLNPYRFELTAVKARKFEVAPYPVEFVKWIGRACSNECVEYLKLKEC